MKRIVRAQQSVLTVLFLFCTGIRYAGGGILKIDVQIKVSEEFMQEFHQTGKTQTSEAARGWVEIENAIKFPVVIRPYLDKETGKMMTFVSYPQRKTDSGYETVFYPTDKEVKKEIETSIYKEFMRVATKDIAPDVSIEDVRVTLLDKPQTGKIALKGIASVKIFRRRTVPRS